MKSSKNPEKPQKFSREKLRIQDYISNFVKLIQENEQKCYELIPLMLQGDSKSRKTYSDFFFCHLRNIFQNEVSTKILKGAAKVHMEVYQFLTVLLLIGNLHIYQNLIQYLLPIFTEIITAPSKTIKTLWPLQSFCRQIIFLMSNWLPSDFFNESEPSIFCQLVKQLRISCDNFQYFNIDKLISCYRIIKTFGLDSFDQKCICEHCLNRQNLKRDQQLAGYSGDKKVHKMREKLYVLQTNQQSRDNSWLTGFQIQYAQDVDELQNLLSSKLSEFNEDLRQSYLYYPLREKIGLLEGHISSIRKEDSQLQQFHRVESEMKAQKVYTPVKEGRLKQSLKETRVGTTSKKQPLPDNQIKSLKLIQDYVDYDLLLNSQFKNENLSFFDQHSLNSKQIFSFKLSLLKFSQKVYLKKSETYKIYCISACKNQTLKIRVYFQGEENEADQSEIKLLKNKNQYGLEFCEQKYEFTINFYDFAQPIQLLFKSQQEQYVFLFPFGFIKLMTILPVRAEKGHGFNFKFTKTFKLMNPFIPSYQTLVEILHKLESLDKNQARSIAKTLMMQKMRGKYERRCALFGCQFLLIIKNNKTQYVDLEIWCEKITKDIRLCCNVLNQFIYINSASG